MKMDKVTSLQTKIHINAIKLSIGAEEIRTSAECIDRGIIKDNDNPLEAYEIVFLNNHLSVIRETLKILTEKADQLQQELNDLATEYDKDLTDRVAEILEGADE